MSKIENQRMINHDKTAIRSYLYHINSHNIHIMIPILRPPIGNHTQWIYWDDIATCYWQSYMGTNLAYHLIIFILIGYDMVTYGIRWYHALVLHRLINLGRLIYHTPLDTLDIWIMIIITTIVTMMIWISLIIKQEWWWWYSISYDITYYKHNMDQEWLIWTMTKCRRIVIWM